MVCGSALKGISGAASPPGEDRPGLAERGDTSPTAIAKAAGAVTAGRLQGPGRSREGPGDVGRMGDVGCHLFTGGFIPSNTRSSARGRRLNQLDFGGFVTIMAKGAQATHFPLDERKLRSIELEVVSSSARLRLTRLLRRLTRSDEPSHRLIRQNAVVNIANTILNRPLYVLESDGWGQYEGAEYAWHQGELELVMRRPDTAQLVETVADLIAEGWLDARDVNEILEADRCGIRFEGGDEDAVVVEIVDVPDLPADAPIGSHPNIRSLFDRLDRAMQDKDWSLVLHTSASIFETLAKLVVSLPSVQNQSLGTFFAAFRKHASLAAPLLDTIEAIYKRRNIEPLSGHGSTADPAITREEALQVAHFTRALVRLHHELSDVSAQAATRTSSKDREHSEGSSAQRKAKRRGR